ncbi:SDR family oxidoreductase, partial [Aeromonas veronii]|nr:SDR family oxidoreductase [Aeromonas veronii]
QHQNQQPGTETEMVPRPVSEDHSYQGSNKLANKVAIITGGDSGIGKAVAIHYAKEGANVVLAARRIEKLAEVEREINEQGNGKVLTVQTDVTNKQNIEDLVKKAEEAFNHVDILVNNAGQMLSSQIRLGKVEEWESMIDVNIKGVLYGIHSVLPSMLERSSGHIINIAS